MKPSTKRKWFGAIAAAYCLVTTELVARGWLYYLAPPRFYPLVALPEEFPTAAKYAPHHYLAYTLQPGYCRGGTHHNSLGFRGEEIAMPKPTGRFRIAVLGGSTTYGEFIDDDAATFPAQLEQFLREQGHNAEVINAGCPGYNSWESLGNLAFRVLDLEPDLVILYDGVNDVHARLVLPAAYRGDNSGRRRVWSPPIEVRIARYSVCARMVGWLIGLWRLPGVDSYTQADTADPGMHGPSQAIGGEPLGVLAQNSPAFYRRNLFSMIGMARAHGAKVTVATWAHSPLVKDYVATPHYQRGVAELNQVVREVALAQQVPCLDFAARMTADLSYWRDGRHVNAKGARLQAEIFGDFLIREKLVP